MAVCSGIEGGTFNGVKENLVANWCPQYISSHNSPNLAGNEEILNSKVEYILHPLNILFKFFIYYLNIIVYPMKKIQIKLSKYQNRYFLL